MYSHRKHAFTLVEMLIVIVIIGILAAALIPRLTGLQARARDTARDADLRNIATAMEVYYIDHGGYPSALYTTPIAFSPRRLVWSEIVIPSVVAQTQGSTIAAIEGQIGQYLKSIPQDPRDAGVAAASNGNCIDAGSSYGYASDGSSWFSVTARSESGKGNTTTCGNTIDRDGDGGYKKQGVGLTVDIQTAGVYPDPSQWTPAGQFSFNISNGTISSYNGPGGIGVIIPATINGVTITNISSAAFQGKQLTSITIPNSVTTIGIRSFASNQLTGIIIPNSVTTIGDAAFDSNQLTSIDIPNSVTHIGNYAFGLNYQLTSVNIPNSVTHIGAGAFVGAQLTNINIPNSVTYIGQEAFSHNQISNLIIPNSVTSIGLAAFYGNQISDLIIPNSVTSIGDYAFAQNPLTSVTIPNSVTSIGFAAFDYNNGYMMMRSDEEEQRSIPRSPISAAHGTRNLIGTTWVKQ